MERGSSKHGARVDDRMADEVRGEVRGNPGGRAEEWRTAEPSGEDQPVTTEALDVAESERFSRFGRYVGLSALPGDRDALRRSAEDLQAPDDILADLDRLPEGSTFQNLAEVWRALGRRTE
ncbi:DUF2795 domain-containing protein [Paractinoplanes rhizophilus]|uniref:DUF2795 domain-containing protein n=1 Tax=Paractinoplanes rhizophilus TaxID=1416877 RepID=A0ABW2I3E5_9ACTN